MPIYEFQCETCSNVFSQTMKMSDPHPDTCPSCGKQTVRKIMSRTSFLLKGSGWYSDGYGGVKEGPAAKPDAKEEAPATPAADGAPAAVPAAKEGGAAAAAPAAAAPAAASIAPAPATAAPKKTP